MSGAARGKLRLALGILIASSLAMFAIWWFRSGVMLVATNGSSSGIRHMKVNYGEGVAEFVELPAGATETQLLGRIGEGATFYIDLEHDDKRVEYRAEVYFMELGFVRTNVFVEIGNDRRVRFRNGKYVTEAIASTK